MQRKIAEKSQTFLGFGFVFLAATYIGYAATTSVCITAKVCFLFCVHGFNFNGEKSFMFF